MAVGTFFYLFKVQEKVTSSLIARPPLSAIKKKRFFSASLNPPVILGEGGPGARDRLRNGHLLRIPVRRGNQRSMAGFRHSGN